MVIPLTRDIAELLLALVTTSVKHQQIVLRVDKETPTITVPELNRAEDDVLLLIAESYPALKRKYNSLYDQRNFTRDCYHTDQFGWPSEPIESCEGY
jgi:hypothetical protein